ncbi:endonuclease/exonuclease/phosphatase family protein [Vineibacter terrae]|uniref:endonuclease/exonuclease/phosphatase family protein n=1 Tax=Vineibacter terrae TaxID=2586908 RepID=UPI002E316236|nr:endonuclease/exonuclease/phosphatase family protein [Vineibacter terrae]HEX2889663.1 endonuclease/exonuclease/phosphatase family protein [Vineibacter terrae]
MTARVGRARGATRWLRPADAFAPVVLFVCAFAVLALLGGWWPLLDFYGQLQAQALVATAAAGLSAISLRLWWPSACSVGCTVALGWSLMPYWTLPPQAGSAPGAGAPLRIVWANLQNWTTSGAALAQLLDSETPTIAVLTELSARHRVAVRAATAYAFRTSFPAGSAFDVMLMSRIRPTDIQFDYTYGVGYPVMLARFCGIDGSSGCLAVVALHAAHPPLPGGARGLPATQRDGQLMLAAAIARRRLDAQDHVLLVGDFNATPYSSTFRAMLAASGLADSAVAVAERPRRPRPTWFSSWPGVGLPIDNALVSPGVRIVERRVGPGIGSDHRPLVLHVRLVEGP